MFVPTKRRRGESDQQRNRNKNENDGNNRRCRALLLRLADMDSVSVQTVRLSSDVVVVNESPMSTHFNCILENRQNRVDFLHSISELCLHRSIRVHLRFRCRSSWSSAKSRHQPKTSNAFVYLCTQWRAWFTSHRVCVRMCNTEKYQNMKERSTWLLPCEGRNFTKPIWLGHHTILWKQTTGEKYLQISLVDTRNAAWKILLFFSP